MAGWSTVIRLPFAPARAIEEFHVRLAHRENVFSLALFFFASTILYALYTAHLMWVRMPGGRFLVGLVVLILAIGLNNFVYILISDAVSDRGQRQKRIGHLLLSTLAISGVFSLMGAAVLEAGVLGLSRVPFSISILAICVVAWQCAVETSNLRRVYGLGRFRALATEIIGRGAGAGMAFSFIGVMSGVNRPWTHWRDLLWIYGVA